MSHHHHAFRNLNPFEIHKILVNDYFLKRPGDTKQLSRDTSKDKTDYDVLRASHRFIWDDDAPATWEQKLAKKYFDKLFKEYAIADLTYYKVNKIALRWRIEKEVISGKGQFSCGNKFCNESEQLRSWEVNFGYVEQGEKKNSLVKLRLCPPCSEKLNYQTKRREVKRIQNSNKKKKKKRRRSRSEETRASTSTATDGEESKTETVTEPDTQLLPSAEVTSNIWSTAYQAEMDKSREEELDEYLENLLL